MSSFFYRTRKKIYNYLETKFHNNVLFSREKLLFLTFFLCCCCYLMMVSTELVPVIAIPSTILFVFILTLFYIWYRICKRQRGSFWGSEESLIRGKGSSTRSHYETEGNTSPRKSRPIKNQNLAFYRNEIPSRPNGDFIVNILTRWTGDYHKLEKNHDYIQWLFPNRQPGFNKQATVLNDEEAKIIRETPILKERVKRAFEMMLDFYGMRLLDGNQICLACNSSARLEKLNKWGNHNFLRISRILLALKELGHQDLMLPWMKILADLIENDSLDHAQSSFDDHWVHTLTDEDKRELEEYQSRPKFTQ